LLLLTSGVNKWADLSPGGSDALAGVQLAMSSGVGFALVCAVVLSGWGLARRFLARRQAAKAAKARASQSSGANGTIQVVEASASRQPKRDSKLSCGSVFSLKSGTGGGAGEEEPSGTIAVARGNASNNVIAQPGTGGSAHGSPWAAAAAVMARDAGAAEEEKGSSGVSDLPDDAPTTRWAHRSGFPSRAEPHLTELVPSQPTPLCTWPPSTALPYACVHTLSIFSAAAP